jgi:dienelactone hydrolase
MAKFAVFCASLCVALMGASAAALAAETLSIPSNPIATAPNSHPAPQPLTAKLYRPAKPGSYPAVIVLHGCGGIGTTGNHEEQWADRLNGWGYAALVVDSLGPRGLPEVCSPEREAKLKMYDRAGDAINAALTLAQTAGIDGHRIGVLGFSHGGGSAVMVTRRDIEASHPGLIRAAVDYYGACNFPKDHGNTPLLVLAGDADTYGNPAKTCTEFKAALSSPNTMEMETYPGVYHEFDNTYFSARKTSNGHPLQYDYAAANKSIERAHAFLDRYVMNAK